MEIRKDFASVSEYLERLVQYASAFSYNTLIVLMMPSGNQDCRASKSTMASNRSTR